MFYYYLGDFMKIKSIVAFLIFAAVLVAPVYSQKTISSSGILGKYGQAISIDPLVFLINKVFNVTYEHRIGESNSLTIFGQYFNPTSYWTGYGIGASYRWYIDIMKDGKRALDGFSVGPMVGFTYWTLDNVYWADQGWGDGGQLYIGAEVSYKFQFENWFIEPNIKYSIGIGELTGLSYDYYGLGVNAGYAW
jgi:hypothetical protein